MTKRGTLQKSTFVLQIQQQEAPLCTRIIAFMICNRTKTQNMKGTEQKSKTAYKKIKIKITINILAILTFHYTTYLQILG